MQTVHVRVIDGATNKPTPVRIRFTDAEGRYYAPLGRLAEFPTGPGEEVGGQVSIRGHAWAYIDGACEVRLPPGSILIEISKGFEYSPKREEVNLSAGKLALRFTISRWANSSHQGWYAGDIRAHELSPHAATLEGAAEGLSIVQLLARERPGSLRNLLAFSGTEAALRSAECQVVVNTLNEHPVLGTVALLDSHRPVYPLRFGEPGTDDWSIADWCDQCHRKRGLVVWPDLPRLEAPHWQGEALAALALGKIDAYEVSHFEGGFEHFETYYRLLEVGLRPALVGGSGKESNAAPLGAIRTYARPNPAEEFTPTAWASAVRAGHTFVTSGPLIKLSIDGQLPGSVVRVESGQPVRVRVEVNGAYPGDMIDVVGYGESIIQGEWSDLEADFVPTRSGWIAARCVGRVNRDGTRDFAHTSPVWIETSGPAAPGLARIEPLLLVLEETRRWVQTHARCDSDKQRQHLIGVLDAGRDVLLQRAGVR